MGTAATTNTFTFVDGFKTTYTSIGNTEHPLMLLVVGSSGIGSLWRNVAAALSPHFRCVYHDKRGFLPLNVDAAWAAKQKNQLISVQQQADDAASILRHLSPFAPAYVFGTSCGATEVLDLTMRYPELVHTAILHEPITFSVIRDDLIRSEMLKIYDLVGNKADTVEGHTIFRNYMFNPPEVASTKIAPVAISPAPRSAVELFNSRGGQFEALAMIQYNVDEAKAKSVREKILIVAGKHSMEQRVSIPGKALAKMLGGGAKNVLWRLPGGHMDFASRGVAKQFCTELLDALQQAGRISLSKDQKEVAKI